jgi:DNA repair exonuclease SbcCD ATPase subunit
VEGVSYAGWGKTLRRTNPWRKKTGGLTQVTTPDLVAARHKPASDAGAKLVWCANGEHPAEWERNKDAQAALEAVIGSWDRWRRTQVFSSADASHFSLATDAERKRLLEAILGLERFDPALAACRGDLKGACVGLAEEEGALETWTQDLESNRKRHTEATQRVEDLFLLRGRNLVPADELRHKRNELNELHKLLEECAADIAQARKHANHARVDLQDANNDLKHAQKRSKKLKEDHCPLCEQEIKESTRLRLQSEVTKAEEEAENAAEVAAEDETVEAQTVADLEEDRKLLQTKVIAVTAEMSALSEKLEAADASNTAYKNAKAAAKSSATDCHIAEKRIGEIAPLVLAHRKEIAILEAAEKVLGMKGVRAQVLGKALLGIESVGNFWLAKMAHAGMRVTLNPYVEKKTGGITDAIGLEITGAGNGHGYKAASGGERRRIDIALLLALAEVSQAAGGGNSRGTLWFDEVFDALDAEGVEAAVSALSELSTERTVVVISHSPALVAKLRPALHLNVDNGIVSTIAA